MGRIRAVLFDVDGTLLDSNDAHAHAWLDALRGHGIDVPYEHVRSRIGMSNEQILGELANLDVDSLEARELVRMRSAVFKAHYLPDLGPLAGARVLVDRIRSRGLRCVAVTSNASSDLADLLRAAAVADLIEWALTEDDIDGRPETELLEVAAERLSLSPREMVFVGDTPYDVAAGKRAGMPVIALRSGGWRDVDLAGAIAVYEGPAQLASGLDASAITQGAPDEDDDAPYSRGGARFRRTSMRGI